MKRKNKKNPENLSVSGLWIASFSSQAVTGVQVARVAAAA
jgi:hypothetical protein